MTYKILSLSDTVLDFIYSPQVSKRFTAVDLVVSCGDLPYYYLEFVHTALNRPLFFVRGNHASKVEVSEAGEHTAPMGGCDLHRRGIRHQGLLLAGVEGSLRYNNGSFQYSQTEMWEHVFGLVPRLLFNRARHGRYLDVFVTHAPPTGIHDQPDLPHRGINAFRWLIRAFQPAVHLHGHIHIYRPETDRETVFGATRVINTYGYLETLVER